MKKVLSALLAIVMIVSFFATGATAYADKDRGFTMEDAYKRYDNVSSFDHVDIRVAGTLSVDGVEKPITVSHPRVVVYGKDNEGKEV